MTEEILCPRCSSRSCPFTKTTRKRTVTKCKAEHRVEVKDCMDCPLLSYDTHEAYNWCAHPDRDCPDAEDSELADKGLPKKCPLRKKVLVIVGQQ